MNAEINRGVFCSRVNFETNLPEDQNNCSSCEKKKNGEGKGKFILVGLRIVV